MTQQEQLSSEALLGLVQQLAAASHPTTTPAVTAPPSRHPLLYPDIWFIFVSLTMALAVTSSFTPFAMLELLTYASIGCNICALVANLTRERPPAVTYKITMSKMLKKETWADTQRRFGIIPLFRTTPTTTVVN
jgi:hypothetical protein